VVEALSFYRKIVWLWVPATFLGMLAGVLHLYVRFSNNTRGEMFDGSGHVDLAYSGLMFFAAFVPVFGAVLLAGVVLAFFLSLFVALMPQTGRRDFCLSMAAASIIVLFASLLFRGLLSDNGNLFPWLATLSGLVVDLAWMVPLFLVTALAAIFLFRRFGG
jgi:hypothetical protein